MLVALNVPLNEERQSLISQSPFQTGEVPAELGAVGSHARHRKRLQPETPRHRSDVVGAEAEGHWSVPSGEKPGHEPTQLTAGRLFLIDHGHQLDVVGAEGDDAIAGAVARVASAWK